MKKLQIGQIVKAPSLGCWVECAVVSFAPGGYVNLVDSWQGKSRCHASRLLVQNESGEWGRGGIAPNFASHEINLPVA